MYHWTTEELDRLHLEWDEKGRAMSDDERRSVLVEVMGANLMKVGEMKRAQAVMDATEMRVDDTFAPSYLWLHVLEMVQEEERLSEWLAAHPDRKLHDEIIQTDQADEGMAEENFETLSAYLRARGPAAFGSWRFRTHLERNRWQFGYEVELKAAKPKASTVARRQAKAAVAKSLQVRFNESKALVKRADEASKGLTSSAEIRERLHAAGFPRGPVGWGCLPELIARGRVPVRGRRRLPTERIAMAALLLRDSQGLPVPSNDHVSDPLFAFVEDLAEQRIAEMRAAILLGRQAATRVVSEP